MASAITTASEVSPTRATVLTGRRTMLHYKPAAIAVLLDMVDADEVRDGIVPFTNSNGGLRRC